MPGLRIRLVALAGLRAERAWAGVSILVSAVALVAFVRLVTLRWDSYETNAFDLAFFDQIIFNTSQGGWFETSFVPYNFAGQHLEPILVAYAPSYWLGGGPYFLMVSQAVVVAAAAIPLHFAAARVGGHPAVGFAAVVAFLANPYLHRAIAFDFHPEVMVALPAFIAAWAVVSGRSSVAVVASLATLLFKEDAVFVALALAGVMVVRGYRREGAITAGVAVAYALLAVFVVMPLIRGGEPSDLVERYGYLLPDGGLAPTAELAVVPFRVARELVSPGHAVTAGLFLASSAAVAVWRPWYLLALVPGLALALLSTHAPQRELELHYAAGLVPVAVLTGVLAVGQLRIPAVARAALLAGPPLIAMVLLNPLADGHGGRPSPEHRRALASALAMIPADEGVVVSAQSGILPRLSQRREAYEFPGGSEQADWIVVDRYGFRSTQSLAAGFDAELAEVRETAELVFGEDGVEVFRRLP